MSNTGSNVTILAIVAVIALVAGGALVLVRRRMN
nr:LPXTG cell wall anchor domain-containing protein [Bifidobacterium dentium]